MTGRDWRTNRLEGRSPPLAIAHSTSCAEPKWRSTRRPTSTSASSAAGVEARDLPALLGYLPPDGAAAALVGHVLDLFRVHVLADDLARDLADQEVVGRHLAADHRQPEAPAGVDRDHARVAAHRVAGEHHPGDLGVDHLLDRDAHRRLTGRSAEPRPIRDRRRAVEADPAVADRVAHALGAPHPEVRLLLAGERRLPAVLAERARAHRYRRLAELRVALCHLVANGRGNRRRPHRLADPVRRGPDRVDVAGLEPRHRGGDHGLEPRPGDERLVPGGREREPGRHRDPGGDQLAERRALAAERRPVGGAQTGQSPGELSHPGSSPCRPSRRPGATARCESARSRGRCRRRPGGRTRGRRSRRATSRRRCR